MERVFGLNKITKLPRPIAALGVFDGVHLGHQAVLAETVRWAREARGAAAVITFDRHPESVLSGRPEAAITSLEHRLALIERTGVDVAIVLHFDRALADLEPEEFVHGVLVERVGVKGMLLGYNTRFGRNARGDARLLSSLGAKYGFDVRTAAPLAIDGVPVSSTLIRGFLTSGELGKAARLLGRPVSLRGTVVHGDRRGKTLGFPTANLNLHHEVTSPAGVYVCRVRFDAGDYWGLVNIGVRPTFCAPGKAARKTVEVYIDEYSSGDELYGKTIEIEILRLLRPERRFDSPEALVAQMEKDRRLLRAFRDSQSRG